MLGALLVLLLLLPLESPFVEASATAASVDDGMRIEVSVEVEGTPTAVLARGLAAGNRELPPVALADRGGGLWEGIVVVPVVENIRLGFEFIPSSGEALVSKLHTLTDLGVDRAIFATPPVTPDPEEAPGTPQGRRWGWLGLAAGAAALTLLVLWTIVGNRNSGDDEELRDPTEEIEDEDSSPIVD